ncbi:MAG: hypothetical protein ABIN69_00375 [Aestuariivirga sp.]
MRYDLKHRMDKLEMKKPRQVRFVAELPLVIEDTDEWLAHVLSCQHKRVKRVPVAGRLDRYVRDFRDELDDSPE